MPSGASPVKVDKLGELSLDDYIQVGSNADARRYVLGTQQGDSLESGNTVTFTVPGVADGMGIADPTIDKDGNTLTHLLGDRGDVAILIHVYVPARLDNTAGVQVMQRQYARL